MDLVPNAPTQRCKLLKYLHGHLNLPTDIWLSLRFTPREIRLLKTAAKKANKRLVTYLRDVVLTNAQYRVADIPFDSDI